MRVGVERTRYEMSRELNVLSSRGWRKESSCGRERERSSVEGSSVPPFVKILIR